ncbi:Zn-dependent protease with chaperone function [hydrothermal vent metagenome]|uniref:Zn-dependent protease with chaperone function n=1 Tax=hydrothermal vent metagenome TaxID=652676 RepID=A0A3B0RGB2_9ZZZZ
MGRHFKKIILSLVLIGFLVACATTPITNRKSLILIPFDVELSLGEKAFRDILRKEKLSTEKELKAMIRRVGKRIAAVSDMPDLDWEFKLVDSDSKNAFALPGGKVAFYEGILKVCKNEAGVATVMGHEIAHAIARHGAERITQQLILTGVITAAAIKYEDDKNKKYILAGLGVGATVGITLPFSRRNESEADHIGLIYMARAGYDPKEAVEFWKRFDDEKKKKKGFKMPAFLSTHPSDEKRVAELTALLPGAMEEYQRAGKKYGKGRVLDLKGLEDEEKDEKKKKKHRH